MFVMKFYFFVVQINMIQLSRNNEHLRDTLFYSIFRESILVDNVESAMNFREKFLLDCRAQKVQKNPPTLFCRTGDKIGSEGIMDPQKGKLSMRSDLTFVFGQIPTHNREEFKAIEEGERPVFVA